MRMSLSAHWSESDKNVNKQKVSGRITACAWSRKGEYFLVALFDGRILLKTFDPADLPNFNASVSYHIGPWIIIILFRKVQL